MGMHKEIDIVYNGRQYCIRVSWGAKESDYDEMCSELASLMKEMTLDDMRKKFDKLIDDKEKNDKGWYGERSETDGTVEDDDKEDAESETTRYLRIEEEREACEPSGHMFPQSHAFQSSGFLSEFFHSGYLEVRYSTGGGGDYNYTLDLDKGRFEGYEYYYEL